MNDFFRRVELTEDEIEALSKWYSDYLQYFKKLVIKNTYINKDKVDELKQAMTFQNLFEIDTDGKLVRRNKTKTINDTLQNIYKKRFKRQTLNHLVNTEEESTQQVWKEDAWFQGHLNNDKNVKALENEYTEYCKIIKECH